MNSRAHHIYIDSLAGGAPPRENRSGPRLAVASRRTAGSICGTTVSDASCTQQPLAGSVLSPEACNGRGVLFQRSAEEPDACEAQIDQ